MKNKYEDMFKIYNIKNIESEKIPKEKLKQIADEFKECSKLDIPLVEAVLVK